MQPSTSFVEGPYVRTLSGATVSYSRGVPTLEDIAIALGRVPRWAGHTTRWWPVLLHSMVVAAIVGRSARILTSGNNAVSFSETANLRLRALLHDAHEAVTGDIPAPFKDAGMSNLQAVLDDRLFRSIGLPVLGDGTSLGIARQIIHEADVRALQAERVLLRPGLIHPERLDTTGIDLEITRGIMEQYPTPRFTDGRESEAVADFMQQVTTLLREAKKGTT